MDFRSCRGGGVFYGRNTEEGGGAGVEGEVAGEIRGVDRGGKLLGLAAAALTISLLLVGTDCVKHVIGVTPIEGAELFLKFSFGALVFFAETGDGEAVLDAISDVSML